MGKNLVGTIILEAIISKKIDKKKLCNGLCSISTLERYLSGERKMDRLTFNAILQRMGMSAESFVTVLDEDEYKYFLWRAKVISAGKSGNWSEVEQLLESYDCFGKCNNKLEKQFYYMAKGVCEYQKNKNVLLGIDYLLQSAKETMPGCEEEDFSLELLNKNELAILIALLKLRIESGMYNDLESIRKKIIALLEVIKNGEIDIHEKVQIYPMVVMVYYNMLCKLGNVEDCVTYCKNAIMLMREHNSSFLLIDILKTYINLMEMLHRGKEIAKEKEWLNACYEIINLTGMTSDNTILSCMNNFGQGIELVNEIIRKGRVENGITQEMLSEWINCDTGTISRIENGKAVPRRKNYIKIMERLNIRDGYYYSDIYAENYRVYELKYAIERAFTDKEYVKAEKLLVELENNIDCEIPCNKQYILEARNSILYETNTIDDKEFLGRMVDILKITVDIRNPLLSERIFTILEIKILNYIAKVYGKLGNKERQKEILMFLYDFYRSGKVEMNYHYRMVLVILQNICVFYYNNRDWENVHKYSLEGLNRDLSCIKGKLSADFLYMYACSCQALYQNDDSLRLLRLSINWAELYYRNSIIRIASDYYDKLVNSKDVILDT